MDALVLRGDEGRDSCEKLRLDAKNRLTRRYPNGETHHVMVFIHEYIVYKSKLRELKHLST